ncbi:MAG: CDP-diacylglycerol--serine O-phosphatidyltransferase [Gemmatimonadetes bacterium]|nr:CDP-diacylglycerol--serine O-phosphatidyltransferase [Gemmatimonadota bacterium]
MTGPFTPRPDVRRAIVVLPNGFTLANLFFGIFAIVSASRGEFVEAGRYVVWGGIADALDGRIARATRSGTRFGSELDSLVDAISFGLAPALIMYFAVLNRSGWDWIFVFLFAACAVIRLARFNVEQAGRAKTYFKGLPSPAAGMTLATYYWFSQTGLYHQSLLSELPWQTVLRWLMIGLSALMISNVPYLAVPRIGLRSVREVLGLVLVIASIGGVIFLPKAFLFPALIVYVIVGLANAAVLGLLDRLPGTVFEDDEDGDADEDERYEGERPRRKRRKRGRRGGTAPSRFAPASAPPEPPHEDRA